MPVRWRFHQESAIRTKRGGEFTGEIAPPGLAAYEIYYGYTER